MGCHKIYSITGNFYRIIDYKIPFLFPVASASDEAQRSTVQGVAETLDVGERQRHADEAVHRLADGTL